MVGRRRSKSSVAPSSSTTQLSLSQSMIVLSKSKTTTVPAIEPVRGNLLSGNAESGGDAFQEKRREGFIGKRLGGGVAVGGSSGNITRERERERWTSLSQMVHPIHATSLSPNEIGRMVSHARASTTSGFSLRNAYGVEYSSQVDRQLAVHATISGRHFRRWGLRGRP